MALVVEVSEEGIQTVAHRGFMRLPEVLAFFGNIGESTWYDWVRDGKAPKPVRLAPRVVVWRVQDIHDMARRFEAGEMIERGKGR